MRSGHIVYVHDGTLFAFPFDADRLEAAGPAVRVLEGVASNALTGGVHFSVLDTGTLVYLTGPNVGAGTPLDLVDRQGRIAPLRATLANWFNPAFAPDGGRLAAVIREGPSETGDIWLHEAGRETMVRLTSDPALDDKPVWTPDGRRITFTSARDGASTPNMYWQFADGSGSAQRLTTSKHEQRPGSWHPSGRFLAFDELSPDSMRDVMILPMEGDDATGWKLGTPTVFVRGPRMDWEPRFSPDGRWIAYTSATESARWEVYVRPFPGPGASVQVSSGGGELPTWSRTRREIIYGMEGQVMIAPFAVEGGRFEVQTPYPWPGGRYQTRGRNRMFDLHPDGERVVLALAGAPLGGGRQDAVQFVFNFFDELRRLAPIAR